MNICINYANGDSAVWSNFKNINRFFCNDSGCYFYSLHLMPEHGEGSIEKEYREDAVKSFVIGLDV